MVTAGTVGIYELQVMKQIHKERNKITSEKESCNSTHSTGS